jgi:hypothetical protein
MADCKGSVLSNIRDAFDEAVSAFIAWDRHGTELTVIFNNVLIRISMIAGVAEVIKDPMPASVWMRELEKNTKPSVIWNRTGQIDSARA